MMTRKRLNTLITLGLMLIYALSMFITYSSCRAYVSQRFSTLAQDFEKNVVEYVNEYNNGEYDDFSLQDFVNAVYDESWLDYPTGVAIYTIGKKAELVAADTSNLYIEELGGLINLEPYMTEDIRRQILELSGNSFDNRTLIADRFYYNKKDGEIIPVGLHIRQQADFKVSELDIQFSDGKAEYYIDGSENLSRIRAYFNFLYRYSFNVKLKDEITDYLLSDMPVNAAADYYTAGNSKDGGGASYTDDVMDSFSVLKGRYYLVANMRQNLRFETLTSDQFIHEAGTLTILYVLLSVIIIVFANKMLSKNIRLNSAKQAFISAAAHELKTPLTVIENQSEFILENIAPQKNEDYIKSIYSEGQRMDKLVRELLQYNRLASGSKIKKEKTSLTEIVNEEVKKYIPLAEQKGISVKTDIEKDVFASVNVELISLAVDNYLSNAVKHTPNGRAVSVKLTGKRLTVYNEGAPVPEEYGGLLFDLFTKTDKSRKNDGSTGMGLAICKEIFVLHKFKYGYENKPNGVEFWFSF